MKRSILLLTIAAAVLLACTGVVLAQSTKSASPRTGDVIPGKYIVVLEESVPSDKPEEEAEEDERDHGARVDHVYKEALKGYSATLSATEAAKVENDPDVKDVVPDRRVREFAQTLPKGIDRIETEWTDSLGSTRPNYADSGVGVAVLDGGIDYNHPDLNVARTSGGNPDGKGCIGTGVNDGNGHGTHVAGTIAAKDDTNGVVGVAPGAKLHPVKVLDAGSLRSCTYAAT